MHFVQRYHIPTLSASRLYDADGKLLYKTGDVGGGGWFKFARDDTPIALSIDSKTKEQSLLKLDLKGKVVARHTLRPGITVEALNAVGAKGPVCVLHKTKKAVFADTLLIWHPETGVIEEIAVADEKLGVVQREMAMSPNGKFAVIRIGRKGVMLYDISKKKVVYKKAINAMAGGKPVRNYLENAVNNDGKVMLSGAYVDASKKYFSTYTLLNQKGEVLSSDLLGDFRIRPQVKLMDDGSFVLSIGNGKPVRIME